MSDPHRRVVEAGHDRMAERYPASRGPEDLAALEEPGRGLSAVLSVGEWEGEESDWNGWGAAMRWSPTKKRQPGDAARGGLGIIPAEVRTNDDGTWLRVLAKKPL